MAVVEQVKEFGSLVELLEDLDREGITGIEKRKHMEKFMLQKSRLRGRPYCASFELTPLCNFDCGMCYVHLTKDQMNREGRILTTEEWLEIMRQSVDAGVTCLDLTGGECLTHPGFKELYRYLTTRGVHVSVLTNGALIDDELIQLFAEHPPAVVQITLYGSCAEAYVKVTGRDAFQDVMGAIAKLKAIGVRVSISVTPNRFMQDDVVGLLKLLHSLQVEYRIGSTTLPARPDTERDIADYIVDNKVLIEISKIETAYRKQNAEMTASQPEKKYTFRIKGQSELVGPPCAAGTANFHVNWKGEMTPCIAFYTVAKSLLGCSVEEAWQWVCDAMKAYQLPVECQGCMYAAICIGCPAEKTFGVLNGKLNNLVCKRTKDTLKNQASLNENECL